MLNRREFLKRLTVVGLVAAAPKLIFDLAANKNKYTYPESIRRDFFLATIDPAYENATHEEILLYHFGEAYKEFEFTPTGFPRRYKVNEAGVYIEVLPHG